VIAVGVVVVLGFLYSRGRGASRCGALIAGEECAGGEEVAGPLEVRSNGRSRAGAAKLSLEGILFGHLKGDSGVGLVTCHLPIVVARYHPSPSLS